ncbi:MAG: GPR endopeptidase [bacterium]
MDNFGRTDLAIEDINENLEMKECHIEKVHIDKNKAIALKKKEGYYYTITTSAFVEIDHDRMNDVVSKIEEVLNEILKEKKFSIKDSVLVMGLGNKEITPDNLGPSVCQNILISKHLIDHGFEDDNLGYVSSITPGVMAQTGMESSEILSALVYKFKPKLVVVVDALASRSIHRVNQTIQITETGINPGSGVGNKRKEISKESLGCDVIAIGVPTVVDVSSIVNDSLNYIFNNINSNEQEQIKPFIENKKIFINEVLGESNLNFMVTPKEIDEIMVMLSECISNAINKVFHRLEKI